MIPPASIYLLLAHPPYPLLPAQPRPDSDARTHRRSVSRARPSATYSRHSPVPCAAAVEAVAAAVRAAACLTDSAAGRTTVCKNSVLVVPSVAISCNSIQPEGLLCFCSCEKEQKLRPFFSSFEEQGHSENILANSINSVNHDPC